MGNDNIESVKLAVNRAAVAVIAEKLDYAGTSNYFETFTETIASTATLTIDVTCNSDNKLPITRFIIDEIRYYMNPTAGETYQLFLFDGPTADDLTQHSDVIFESPAALVDSTEYIWRHGGMGSFPNLATVDLTLPCTVDLHTAGKLYYMLDWTGDPGNTPGYIKIKGRLLK